MTAHPIDTEALRATAEATIEEYGPLAWPDIPSTDLLALLDALAAAEHRATRAEAQSTIRGRAVAIHRERARVAEAERDYRKRENAELHESWLLLSSDTATWQQRAVYAEAQIQAVRNMCARASRDAGTLERNLLGGHRLYPKEILRALDGDA